MKEIACFNCGNRVAWGEETVYSESGALICLSCFEVEAEEKEIIIQDGQIVSNHCGPSEGQDVCLNCLSCCREIGCSLVHPEKGCLIYDKRPDACREFFCKALQGDND